MGWLEVLAMLKRLGPTLSRLLPMLEMFIATRGSSHTDAEVLDRFSAEIKAGQTEAANRHGALAEALAGQSKTVASLREDVRYVREAGERSATRLLELETQVGTLAKAVQGTKQLTVAILTVCLLLLGAVLTLLFRR